MRILNRIVTIATFEWECFELHIEQIPNVILHKSAMSSIYPNKMAFAARPLDAFPRKKACRSNIFRSLCTSLEKYSYLCGQKLALRDKDT